MSDGAALVVGGSGAIGAACCRALARDGHDVVVGFRSSQGAAEAVADEAGGTTRRLDLPDGELGDLSDVGTLVWAAGADIGQPYVSEIDLGDLRHAVDVEVHGFARMLTACLPALRAHGGCVVAVSSAGIGRHPPGDVLSTAPKAAMEAMLRAVAREEGRYGVRANVVRVGVVEAGQFDKIGFDAAWRDAAIRNIPLRRFGDPADVAEAVAWLAGPRAAYVTGQVVGVDGGYAV